MRARHSLPVLGFLALSLLAACGGGGGGSSSGGSTNDNSQTGGTSTGPHALTPFPALEPSLRGYDREYTSVAIGAKHLIAVRKDGSIVTNGANTEGQLGRAGSASALQPTVVPGIVSNLLGAVYAGDRHSGIVGRVEGQTGRFDLFTFGDNSHGQLGRQATVGGTFPIPSRVRGPNRLTAYNYYSNGIVLLNATVDPVDGITFSTAAFGANHTLANSQEWSDNVTFAWGDNAYGQLGTGDTVSRSVPTLIPTGGSPNTTAFAREFAQLAAGGRHSLGITRHGDLYAWGDNRRGQLGLGDQIQRTSPTFVGSGYASVHAGDAFTVAITIDRKVMVWGDNTYGQLGLVGGSFASAPIDLQLNETLTVSVGRAHVVATVGGINVLTWGDNRAGQLADRSGESGATKRVVAVYTYHVYAGGDTSLINRQAGYLMAAGDNSHGQYGNGKTVSTDYFDDTGIVVPVYPTGVVDYTVCATIQMLHCPPGGTGSGSGGSSGGGSGGGSNSSGDALDYAQVKYSFTCSGSSRVREVDVSNGPCISQQQAFGKAFMCNEYDADYTVKSKAQPFYSCLVNNSSGSYKTIYQDQYNLYR